MKAMEVRLRDMLVQFVGSSHRSRAAADAIAGFLIEHFYEDEDFAELLVALSSYRPEGGEFLHNEDSILGYCTEGIATLDRRA
jgi:hypothetical protein